ncbi:MAG: CopG family antitoxin [bacterium]
MDWNRGRQVAFPKLKPSVKTISLCLPEIMLEELKLLANRMDVPCQSLMKIYNAKCIRLPHQQAHQNEIGFLGDPPAILLRKTADDTAIFVSIKADSML